MKKLLILIGIICFAQAAFSQIIVDNTKSYKFLDSLTLMTKLEQSQILKMQNYKYKYDETYKQDVYINMDSDIDIFIVFDYSIATWMSAIEFNSFRKEIQLKNYKSSKMEEGVEYYKADMNKNHVRITFVETLGVYVVAMYNIDKFPELNY